MAAAMIATHGVADFKKWLEKFENFEDFRKSQGETASEVLQDPNDPKMVTVISWFQNKEQATSFINSQELKSAMESAGVTSAPTISVLEGYQTYRL